MKKYRLAFCGVFDLANYGDHLFPIVFGSEMDKRGLSYDLILFSPIECKQAFNNFVPVYALKDLEKIHIENPFDAIIVAGGEIIHLFKFFQKTKIDAIDYDEYDIAQTWLIPAFVSIKYNIKLIWNAPGVPFNFIEPLKNFVKAICNNISYLSVRNSFSKECLLNCGIKEEKIKVIPDTALCLSSTVSKEYLNNIRTKLLDFNDKYIVFHTNRSINKLQIEEVINCLNKLKESGYKVVLLPLAYTHGDDNILRQINELSGNKYYLADKFLDIREMMSILAGCQLYIGTSFHGAITALQYGNRVIAFDFMENSKTKNLFEYFNMEKYYITKVSDLEKSILNAEVDIFDVDIKSARSELEIHFNNVFDLICGNKKIDIEANEFALEISDGIVQNNIIISKCDEIKKGLEWYENQEANTKIYIKELNNIIEEQKKGLEWYQKQDVERLSYIEILKNKIYEQNKGLEWHRKYDDETKIYVNNLESYIEEQKKGLEWYQEQENKMNEYIKMLENNREKEIVKQNELQAKIFLMENSLSWKITRFLRKK